jgi:hypothetical protein
LQALFVLLRSGIIVINPSMSNSNNRQFQANGSYRPNAIDVVCVIAIVTYFLHFALPSLAGGFNEDEMTNIYVYWHPGTFKAFLANICFWRGIGRPAGALYYLPLYHFFDLDPRPYRFIQISILALSIPMLYYLARLLSSSRLVAFLAVLVLCYHAQLAELVFIGSFIYDVLCGFFYFAALTYYIHIREKEPPPRPVHYMGILLLYICALNCKEMAVTLPLIVLIYEALKYPRFGEWKQFFRRNWRFAIPALIAALLTGPYIYGKTQGSNALARLPGYRLEYSWHGFTTSNARFVNELFYYVVPNHIMTGGMLIAVWAAVFLYAFLRRDRMLCLMAFWVVITPLPLAFIPARGGACLYVPLFGWAMIFAKLVSDLIMLVSKSSTLLGEGVGAGATTGAIIGGAAPHRVWRAAIGPAVGTAADKTSPAMFRVFATVLVAFGLAILTQWENQRLDRIGALLSIGEKASHVIQAFRSLDLHPAHGSRILLRPEKRFYQNGYYPAFVAYLVWNDHSLQTYVAGQGQLTEQQIIDMNYIISFSEFELKVIRGPEPVRR